MWEFFLAFFEKPAFITEDVTGEDKHQTRQSKKNKIKPCYLSYEYSTMVGKFVLHAVDGILQSHAIKYTERVTDWSQFPHSLQAFPWYPVLTHKE